VEMNEEAQIYTLEGFVAASLMILTVMMVIKSSLIITPQSELMMDVKLKQTVDDAIAVIDMAPKTAFEYNLTELVAGWNGAEYNFSNPQNNGLTALENEMDTQLKDISYNIDFAYVENPDYIVKHAIIHGKSIDNSVVATRLVTLYNSTVTSAGGSWNISPNELKVVEVRLIAWQV
jgi:hypothetical protein